MVLFIHKIVGSRIAFSATGHVYFKHISYCKANFNCYLNPNRIKLQVSIETNKHTFVCKVLVGFPEQLYF